MDCHIVKELWSNIEEWIRFQINLIDILASTENQYSLESFETKSTDNVKHRVKIPIKKRRKNKEGEPENFALGLENKKILLIEHFLISM